MLVEFRVKNFRSFKNEECISFVASGEENPDSRCIPSKNTTVGNLLRSAAVYGANASGKSNLTLALASMKHLVQHSTQNQQALVDLYTPFRLDESSSILPTEFDISIIIDETMYHYYFSYDAQKIHTEELLVNNEKWFSRVNEEWIFYDPFKTNNDLHETWQKATRPSSLFITTAIQLNCQGLKPLFEWLVHKIIIISAHPIEKEDGYSIPNIDDPNHKEVALTFLKNADLGIQDIRKIEKNDRVDVEFGHRSADGTIVWFDRRLESLGTQKLLNYSLAHHHVFLTGSLLVIDEIENSLHPLIAKEIIHQFHNQGENGDHPQLWMITHNTSLLTNEIFRRDQIWFVEKNDKQESQLYSLEDFKPADGEVFDRDYLMGRYGALPFIEKKGF